MKHTAPRFDSHRGRACAGKPARLVLAVLLALLAGTPGTLGRPAQSAADRERLLRSVDDVLATLEEIRGIPSARPIARGIKSREEIRAYVVERLGEAYPPEVVRAEGELLGFLGLLPADLDYSTFFLDLLTEQIAGYYDPVADVFYLADWLPEAIQLPVMAHELTHALQDQQVELSKLLEPDLENEDRTLARAAVFEGEGLLVMLLYALRPMGTSLQTLPDIVRLQEAQLPLMEAQFPVFAAAPAFLKASLMFPYTYGAAFVRAYLERHGWSQITRLYRDLPTSTEQILHPEKYLGVRDDPTPVPSPAPPDTTSGWAPVLSLTLGEFGLRELLRRFVAPETAAEAAAGWDGDRLAYWKNGNGKSAVTLRSRWDSENDANAFAAVMRSWLQSWAAWRSAETAGDSERTLGVPRWAVETAGVEVTVRAWETE